MVTFHGENLSGSEFRRVGLRDARFIEADLSGVLMRAVDLAGADNDAPWLLDGESTLMINGVDVAPMVEAELNRRFPGREQRRASDPAELRAAWTAVERAWAAAIERARAMPTGTLDQSVAGEWSFAQTLRHLVMATDTWLRGAILRLDRPFHPMREFLAATTQEHLDEPRSNPWSPDHRETVRSCLHTILDEEWEHLRFALRDLDQLAEEGRQAPA